ncbi:MAG: flagellar hook-length control protein FliK [Sphingomonas oligoaromativorans]
MNVAPIAPTPTPARAADAPSPAASAFGGLLEMAGGTSGGTATPAAQPGVAPAPTPVEPVLPQPVASAAPVADHRPPVSAPLPAEPEVQPDQPVTEATPPEAETAATPTPATSPTPAAPTPATVAATLVTQLRPRQAIPTDDVEARKPVVDAKDDDAAAKDGKGLGTDKDKTAKSAPAASGDAQPPQPVMLAAAPAPATLPPPSTEHAAGQKSEGTDATGGSAGTSAVLPTPHDPAGAAPAANGPDNLPPLLASQTPALTQPVRQAPVFAPSAVPQDSPVVAAEPGRIGRDIGVEIARHVAAGRDEVTIRLTPAEMGHVEVRLSFDDKGALHAAVRADNPQALDMLRRDAGDLGRSLADAGIRADSSSFSFDRRDGGAGQFAQQQHQQQHSHSDGRPRHAGTAFRDRGDGDPIASLSPYRQLRTSGRVDLMA